MNTKCDYHIHMGQWHEIYYEPRAVIGALKSSGTDEIYFSSTTSERYCKESFAVRENADLQKSLPTACELYEFIQQEVSLALKTALEVGLKVHPLYWVVPEVHFAGAATIVGAMSDLPYEGFKLHPRGNRWDLSDAQTMALAEEVFSYADRHELLVLIHCGENDFELPTRFEPFIARYPHCTVQLAHCRPLKEMLYMLKKYPNTLCDTAFVSGDTRQKIESAGFADRIRYGTDFPITHYFSERPNHDPTEEELARWTCEKK